MQNGCDEIKDSVIIQEAVEAAMMGFLHQWAKRDFRNMLEFIQITWKDKRHDAKEYLEQYIGNYRCSDYQVVCVDFINDAGVLAVITFSAVLYDSQLRIKQRKQLTARVICESAPYEPDTAGTWGVNPDSLIKSLYN